MADKKAAVASGADPAGDAARRRNVPGSATPGTLAQQPELDEKKVHGKKKVYICALCVLRVLCQLAS